MQSTKAKTRISITIVPMVDKLLTKYSKRAGISKSSLVERAIRDFLEQQLDKDTKSLAAMKFDDLPSENEWLSLQSSIE